MFASLLRTLTDNTRGVLIWIKFCCGRLRLDAHANMEWCRNGEMARLPGMLSEKHGRVLCAA